MHAYHTRLTYNLDLSLTLFWIKYFNEPKKIFLDENTYKSEDAVVHYTTTQRGRTMLCYNGYNFVENRQSTKNTFWRCSRYVKYGCRATVVTSKSPNELTIRTSGQQHTHDCEKTKFVMEPKFDKDKKDDEEHSFT